MSKWTTKRPDKPGWWWCRRNKFVRVLDVYELFPGAWYADGVSLYKMQDYEWSDAPLAEPEEGA